MDDLTRELERRAAIGLRPLTLQGLAARLASIGYKLDRSGDCPHISLYVTGEHAGETYPAISSSIREADTGLSFANVDARRDGNFRTLQEWRSTGELFAVVRGHIFEV